MTGKKKISISTCQIRDKFFLLILNNYFLFVDHFCLVINDIKIWPYFSSTHLSKIEKRREHAIQERQMGVDFHKPGNSYENSYSPKYAHIYRWIFLTVWKILIPQTVYELNYLLNQTSQIASRKDLPDWLYLKFGQWEEESQIQHRCQNSCSPLPTQHM